VVPRVSLQTHGRVVHHLRPRPRRLRPLARVERIPAYRPFRALDVVVLHLEVDARRVVEQQVDLQVQQVGSREEHRLLHHLAGRQQEVHRPVELLVVRLVRRAVHEHVAREPLGDGVLGRRVERPVRHHRQDASDHRVRIRHALAPGGLPKLGADPKPVPQAAHEPRRPHRARLDEPHLLAGLGGDVAGELVLGTEEVVDAVHEPAEGVDVEGVTAAEVAEDAGLGVAGLGVVVVVGELDVLGARAVPVLAGHDADVHN
jgi:hypothetical protein